MFWGLSLKPHRNFSYEPAIRLMVVFGDGGGGEIAFAVPQGLWTG